MTSRLNISAPATLTVLSGNAALSSLQNLPPGITISGAAGGTLSVTLQTGVAGALVSAGGLTGSTITLGGNAAEVNAALAGLRLNEPGFSKTDILTLTANAPGLAAAQTEMVVNVVPATGPAFVAPAQIVTLSPNTPVTLPALLLSDPVAEGLAAMGLGQEETLCLTLSVAAGVLLLPGLTGMSGITASGIGTGTIELSFTADEIGVFNSVLAGLEFAGPALQGGQHLDYTLWNLNGVLPRLVTYGNIFLNTIGLAAAGGTYVSGADTLVTGGLEAEAALGVVGTLAVLGDATLAAGVSIAPGAALEVPYGTLTLGGTSLDFGQIDAAALVETGTLLLAAGGTITGPVQLNGGAGLEFAGGLIFDAGAGADYAPALSLAAGAVLQGSGVLALGNFSASGKLTGPGTLLAQGGETLVLDAGAVTGGAQLQVAAGGVMVLDEIAPLYGIFDTTPLTIDHSVTLSFLGNAGAVPVGGGYASTLGGAGGAFVITGPQLFSGTIAGFAPGDALIFPGLSGFTVYNVSPTSFSVLGVDDTGTTRSYTISATAPAGYSVAGGVDAAGDGMVYLRPAAPTVTSAVPLSAAAGQTQPLPGLVLEVTGTAAQSLSLTVAVAHGGLSLGSLAPAATLTLSGANVQALNAELAGLSYTGTGVNDALSFTGNIGLLAGLDEQIGITATPAVGLQSYAAAGLTAVTLAQAVPGVDVAGMVEFEAPLLASGYAGTALRVETGGLALFGPAATAALGGDVTLDGGTLAVLGTAFAASGNISMSGASEAVVSGALTATGNLALASGMFALGGAAMLGGASLGPAGTLLAYGAAQGALGAVQNAGALTLANDATLSAASYDGAGALALGGTALWDVSGGMTAAAAAEIAVGLGAALNAGTLSVAGAMNVAGHVAVASGLRATMMALAGGAVTAESFAGGLTGYGALAAAEITDTGTIAAQGGRLILAGSIVNAGMLAVGTSAALELSSTVSGAAVRFAGASAVLVLDDVASGFSGIANMVGSDVVDLVGIAPSLVSYGGGTVAVLDMLGNTLTAFAVGSAPGQPGVSIVSDQAGGALLTLGGEMPCFARGTRLLTPSGYRAVEELRPGDPLITATGARRPLRWLGWRTLDLGPAPARHALPVLVMPGAFGPGRPSRMLRLSPLHCVYADGVLIPVTHLVNGVTIRRERKAAATYYHVELDRHDILLAEGLECESYFCAGNRGALYHELGRRSPAAKPYAPSVTRGARLAAVRRRLHNIALAGGFTPGYVPRLRVLTAAGTAIPEISRAGAGRMAKVAFSRPVRHLTLLANPCAPAETDPDSEDWREVSLCLGEMRGAVLGAGWHPAAPSDGGRWMGARAELHLPRARRRIVLPLAAVARSWLRPALDARWAGG